MIRSPGPFVPAFKRSELRGVSLTKSKQERTPHGSSMKLEDIDVDGAIRETAAEARARIAR